VARLERDLAWLPMGVAPVAPTPGLARRMASRILDRPSPWRYAIPYGLAAAMTLLAIGVGVRGRAEQAGLENQLATRDQRLAALQDTLSIVQGAQQILQAKISMNGHDGGLVIFQEPISHRWYVVVHGLPPAPSGNVYQFWFITTSGMVRSVEVRGDPEHPAVMTLGMPPVPAPVMGAALTVEPAVHRSTEPSGPMLAHVTF
jgi:Anti-sigma-K factor rskA, C-terminal